MSPAVCLLVALVAIASGQIINESQVESETSLEVSSSLSNDTTNLKCAASYCLPADYDKLEVPYDDDGLVHVSVDLDTLQILEVGQDLKKNKICKISRLTFLDIYKSKAILLWYMVLVSGYLVTIYLLFFQYCVFKVDDVKFTVMFSLYFGVRWKENRIVGPKPDDENYYQPIDTGFIKHLWVPGMSQNLETSNSLFNFIPRKSDDINPLISFKFSKISNHFIKKFLPFHWEH